MFQPWEQDQLESLTLEQMFFDVKEIGYNVDYLYNPIVIERDIEQEKNVFKNNTKKWTILEEALKLQKIIEMYLEFIVESGEFSNFSDSLTTYLEKIDDVIVVLQKFYKKLEEKFAETLILES